MRFLIVDDERRARENLAGTLRKAVPDGEIILASGGEEALGICRESPVYAAFIDIEMPGMDGIELLERIRSEFPRVNCIMVTAYSQYALDAIHLHASGYLIKPVSEKDLKNELSDMRVPLAEPPEGALLTVRCFGFFQVWCRDEVVKFKRARTKELLAYLIALKGASANTGELCGVLFERDGSREKNYLRQLISELRTILAEYSAEDVLITSRNSYAVDPGKIDCDYYRTPQRASNYTFMEQYSWAEFMKQT